MRAGAGPPLWRGCKAGLGAEKVPAHLAVTPARAAMGASEALGSRLGASRAAVWTEKKRRTNEDRPAGCRQQGRTRDRCTGGAEVKRRGGRGGGVQEWRRAKRTMRSTTCAGRSAPACAMPLQILPHFVDRLAAPAHRSFTALMRVCGQGSRSARKASRASAGAWGAYSRSGAARAEEWHSGMVSGSRVSAHVGAQPARAWPVPVCWER